MATSIKAGLAAPMRAAVHPAKAEKKAVANDAELAAGLVLTPIYKDPQKGVGGLVRVMQGANDPAGALAHSIFGLMSQARNAAVKNGIKIDPRAWTANGGALDKVIIDLGGLLASTAGPEFVDKKFGQNVKRNVLSIMAEEKAHTAAAMGAGPSGPMPPDAGGIPMAGPPGAGLAAPAVDDGSNEEGMA